MDPELLRRLFALFRPEAAQMPRRALGGPKDLSALAGPSAASLPPEPASFLRPQPMARDVTGIEARVDPLVENRANPLERLAGALIAPSEYPEEIIDPRRAIRESRDVQDVSSEDAWALYLGMPQKFDSFELSPFKPTEASDQDAKYLRLHHRDQVWDNVLKGATRGRFGGRFARHNKEGLKTLVSILDESEGRTVERGDEIGLYALADFTLSKGEDERGPYISLYDKWDLNQPLEGLIGKPFEIYDRLYYDPKTFEPLPDQPEPSRSRRSFAQSEQRP